MEQWVKDIWDDYNHETGYAFILVGDEREKIIELITEIAILKARIFALEKLLEVHEKLNPNQKKTYSRLLGEILSFLEESLSHDATYFDIEPQIKKLFVKYGKLLEDNNETH